MFFRAVEAIPQTMRGPGGGLANAVRGTLDTLARYVTDRRPRHLAFTTDEDWRPDWRVELIPGYKEHRTAEPIPPALIPQVPIILASLAAVGVDVVGLEGYEAEDIVASLAVKVKTPIEIASGDRDLFSLVRGRDIIVLYPQKGGMVEVDEAEVARRYSIPGRAYADYAILRGDPSDGLPGIAAWATRRPPSWSRDMGRSGRCSRQAYSAMRTPTTSRKRSAWSRRSAIFRSKCRAAGATAIRSTQIRLRSSARSTGSTARWSA